MTTSMDIPADVLVSIILRLPPSCRRLARLVCRQWRDVVDTRTAEMQSRAKPLVVTDAGSAHVVDDLSTGSHRVLWNGVPTDLLHERRNIIIGTCNGLICLCDNQEVGGAITLINPVTGEKLYVPPLPSTTGTRGRRYIAGWHEAYGFGYHPTTGRHKIVHVAAYGGGGKGSSHRVKVFTLGGSSWRDVATGSGPPRCKYSAGVVSVDGTMYWAAKRGRKLVAFDLEHERLSLIKSLPDPNVWEGSWKNLTEVRGRLGVVVYSFYHRQCEVWVLEGGATMREHKWSRWYMVRRDISSFRTWQWQLTRPHFAHSEYLLAEELAYDCRVASHNVVYKHKLNGDSGMVKISETSPGTRLLAIKAAFVAPVLKILPELQKLCEEPTSPISMVLPKEMESLEGALVGLTAPSLPSLEPSQPLAFVDREDLDDTIALSPVAVGQVVHVGAEVGKVDALAPNSETVKSTRSPIFDREEMLARIDEAVFVKELRGLLADLEAASPGSAMAIACLLAEKASTDKMKKVKKVLESIGKKSGVFEKASAAA